jgi:hypothetical protein
LDTTEDEMSNQPDTPQADKAALAIGAVRAHIYVAVRDNVADDPAAVTLPDGGGPITVTAYGRTIQITTQDITDGPNRCTMHGLWCGCPNT